MTPVEEFDPQSLLPPDLRKTWVVAPRHRLHMAVLFFVCLAAALTLGVVGFVLTIGWMKWAPGLTFAVFALVSRMLKRKDARCEAEAKKYTEPVNPNRPA